MNISRRDFLAGLASTPLLVPVINAIEEHPNDNDLWIAWWERELSLPWRFRNYTLKGKLGPHKTALTVGPGALLVGSEDGVSIIHLPIESKHVKIVMLRVTSQVPTEEQILELMQVEGAYLFDSNTEGYDSRIWRKDA